MYSAVLIAVRIVGIGTPPLSIASTVWLVMTGFAEHMTAKAIRVQRSLLSFKVFPPAVGRSFSHGQRVDRENRVGDRP